MKIVGSLRNKQKREWPRVQGSKEKRGQLWGQLLAYKIKYLAITENYSKQLLPIRSAIIELSL